MIFSICSSPIVYWSGYVTTLQQMKNKQASWKMFAYNVYNDKRSSFEMLLEKHSSVSIYDGNIQSLATEMYKVSNGLSPHLVSNIFRQKVLTLTIYDLILSFPDLLLGLYFTGLNVHSTLVQLSGTLFLIIVETYLILVFLKTGLKNGSAI